MAVNRTPVLKRCRSLEMDPVYLGIDKKSRRKAKTLVERLASMECSFVRSRRLSSSTVY